jgi:hypothetical protein
MKTNKRGSVCVLFVLKSFQSDSPHRESEHNTRTCQMYEEDCTSDKWTSITRVKQSLNFCDEFASILNLNFGFNETWKNTVD